MTFNTSKSQHYLSVVGAAISCLSFPPLHFRLNLQEPIEDRVSIVRSPWIYIYETRLDERSIERNKRNTQLKA